MFSYLWQLLLKPAMRHSDYSSIWFCKYNHPWRILLTSQDALPVGHPVWQSFWRVKSDKEIALWDVLQLLNHQLNHQYRALAVIMSWSVLVFHCSNFCSIVWERPTCLSGQVAYTCIDMQGLYAIINAWWILIFNCSKFGPWMNKVFHE